jgi:glycerophosphoryl diester phosphodiesterase
MRAPNQQQKSDFWKNFKAPMAVAHRGGDIAGIEKENSMAAFRAAYKLGYRWLETDVVATKDKKLIMIHGKGYQLRHNRHLPTRTKLRWMSYETIQKKILVGGERIALLEELLDEFPDTKIFLDPKTAGSVPLLVKLLAKRPKDIDRICIGSFPKMRTIRMAYLIKRKTGKEVATVILGPTNAYPIYMGARRKFFRIFAKYYVQETKATCVNIPYRWITNSPKAGRKFVEFAHELGLKVGVYTPNSRKTIQKCLNSGVDVIMSDRSKLLLELAENYHKK